MDRALNAAGAFGKFQKITALVVISMGAIPLLLGIGFPLLTSQPEFLCREKGNVFENFEKCYEEDLCKYEILDYEKNIENSLINMTYEFDLTCDRKYFINMYGSAFFFGGILGSLILSPIPDRKGRAPIYKILLFMNLVLQISAWLSFSPFQLIFIFFLTGFSAYAMSMSTLIVTEYMERSKAGKLMTLHAAIFPLSGLLITLFFLYINNWRLLFFIYSVYSAFLYYAVYFYFVESPRWLNSNNRSSECLVALRRIAEINGNSKTFEIFLEKNPNLLNSNEYENLGKIKNRTYNIFEVYNLKSQKLNLICLSYIWLAVGFCFYGLILNMEHLGGNIYINSIITFIAEITSEFISGYLAETFGRVVVLKISGVIGGVAFIIYEFIPAHHWYKVFFLYLTSFGFASTFNLSFIYSPEVFPTTIRSTVMGFLYLFSRIGALLVPIVTPFISHINVLFGVLSIISSYASMFLKETLGKEIPDDVPESINQCLFLGTNGNKLKKYSVSSTTVIADDYFKNHQF